MLMLLFYYIKYLQNVLTKLLNVNDEITIFIIILNLCYNEKIKLQCYRYRIIKLSIHE